MPFQKEKIEKVEMESDKLQIFLVDISETKEMECYWKQRPDHSK